MATVVLTPEAVREVAALPTPIVARIAKLVDRPEGWPQVSGAKPLRGDLAGHFRRRTGDYRLQFRVETTRTVRKVEGAPKKGRKGPEGAQEQEVVEHMVIVEKVGHRDGFYDE
jgi:mRNA-degrading endonuclease RelE of RelBE toxin-antitoxin system